MDKEENKKDSESATDKKASDTDNSSKKTTVIDERINSGKEKVNNLFKLLWDDERYSVKTNPFTMFLGFLLIGLILGLFIPASFILSSSRNVLGVVVSLLGVSGLIFSFSTLISSGTKVSFNYSELSITYITKGLYKYSRNPILLSLISIGLGLGFVFDNLWLLLIQIPYFLLLDRVLLPKEEEKFESLDGYAEYKKKTRRWF